MGTEGVNSLSNIGCDSRGVPRWCVGKISLLSREEIDAIVCMHDVAAASKITSDDETQGASFTAGSSMLDQHRSFKLRVAWLPMFLQMEALVLRRHEQQYRQHMKDLVELSECVAMVCNGSLRAHMQATTLQGAEDQQKTRQTEDDALRSMLRQAEELENSVRAAAVNSLRCAQRMFLAAAVTKQRSKTMRKQS